MKQRAHTRALVFTHLISFLGLSRMALSMFSTQVVAFVPGSAVTVQQSTRVAAASNIVSEEVRRTPLAHAHNQADHRETQRAGFRAHWKRPAKLRSGYIATISRACAENAVLIRA